LRTSHYRPIIERMRDRHGRRRGCALASVEIARRLTKSIWWMLTRNQPFAPAGALTAPTVPFRIALPEQAPIEPDPPTEDAIEE
jgi:hypothetical protein